MRVLKGMMSLDKCVCVGWGVWQPTGNEATKVI